MTVFTNEQQQIKAVSSELLALLVYIFLVPVPAASGGIDN